VPLPPPARQLEALLAGVSRNLRSQVGRRERALQRTGDLGFRTVAGGPELPSALDHLLRVEASGWKARAGTAILNDPAAEALYRSFAARASARGWLRVHLLELDGEPIAADLNCSFGRTGLLIKTGFDERHAALSPGLVLRARVLRAAIEEGLEFYDFLAGAQPYKLRWGAQVRRRVTLLAYRGPQTCPDRLYERRVRRVAKEVALATVLRKRRRRSQTESDTPADV
jgi:CelD/BcsL family acetyltransferase involved in cellulose biosynthesis